MLQDLITHCTVVTEKQFKNMLQDVYKRKCRFKYASWAVKCAAGNALHENSAAPVLLNKKAVHADFFDLEGLRNNEVVRPALPQFGDTASMQQQRQLRIVLGGAGLAVAG